MKRQTVSLYDFDGTLTRRSTIVPFFLAAVPAWTWVMNSYWFIPQVCLYAMKLRKFEDMMTICAKRLLIGLPEDDLVRAGRIVVEKLGHRNGFWPQTILTLEANLENGFPVAIVTGGFDFVARAWLARRNFDCEVFSSTLLYNENQRVVGVGDICFGDRKLMAVSWAKSIANQVCSYGDSAGDIQMLCGSDYGFWVDKQGFIYPFHRTSRETPPSSA